MIFIVVDAVVDVVVHAVAAFAVVVVSIVVQ